MISIVVPARNEERNIGVLMESVKRQSYDKPFETVVVDGNSTDRTVGVAERYGARVVKQGGALGVGNARNMGWKHAKGDIIVFLEADHVLDGNFLSAVEKAFDSDIDSARYNIIPAAHNWVQKTLCVQIALASRRGIGDKKLSVIFRRNVLEQTGGFDESLGFGDERLLPERVLCEGYKVMFIDDAIIHAEPVDSIGKLFKEGKWYGRNIIRYIIKSRDYMMLFGVGVYALTLPAFLVGLAWRPLLYLAALMFAALLGYAAKGFAITRSPYSFFIPLINMIRGTGELVGILQAPFKKHRGR